MSADEWRQLVTIIAITAVLLVVGVAPLRRRRS
jgi:MYXO-CTERM domain-containing protein